MDYEVLCICYSINNVISFNYSEYITRRDFYDKAVFCDLLCVLVNAK